MLAVRWGRHRGLAARPSWPPRVGRPLRGGQGGRAPRFLHRPAAGRYTAGQCVGSVCVVTQATGERSTGVSSAVRLRLALRIGAVIWLVLLLVGFFAPGGWVWGMA